jgi:archaemetzincin
VCVLPRRTFVAALGSLPTLPLASLLTSRAFAAEPAAPRPAPARPPPAAPPSPPQSAASSAASSSTRVLLVPLGPVSPLELATVTRALLTFYALDITPAEPRPLPRSAFYPKRGRYRAERLLAELNRTSDPSALRVLGLTSVDISTTKGNVEDWGILGLASLDGRVGVLSSFRCRRLAKSKEQIAYRLGKTAVHELGHTFGLEHCPSAACLMRDGQGSVLTTDGDYDLCATCREKLRARALLLTPSREPPWPKPV